MERTTHCPLDCPDACSLRLRVHQGRLVSVDGDHRNPITGGFICGKVRRLPRHLYGEHRLLHPAIRRGPKGRGAFTPVSWDEALSTVADRLVRSRQQYGGESILPFCYGGSNGVLTQGTADARLFRRLGASRLARTVCAAPTTAAAGAMYGKMPGVAFEDYVHARLIIVWGCNPAVSGIHLMPYIQQARRAGARLVVVDPRHNRLARQADLHLAVYPGSDVAVALSVAGWLLRTGRADTAFLEQHATGVEEFRRRAERWSFERAAEVARVDAAEIERLARWYAETSPAVIRCGWGLERNRNGGSAAAAVLALPTIAGKFGVRGGGYTLSNSGAFALDLEPAIRAPEAPTRVVNMNRLGRALAKGTDPPVKVLFVYNSNPAATLPEQERVLAGLAREDLFTVVFDQVATDTSRYADVVLPATAFPEHAELRAGYGAMVLQYADPAVSAPGQARPNYQVFTDLCERTGLAQAGDPVDPRSLVGAILGHGSLDRLLGDGIELPAGGARPLPFVDSMPRTDDHKVHLVPVALDGEAPEGLYGFRPDPESAQYPLALVSPATGRTISSTFGQLRSEPVRLRIHPDDAAVRGVVTGTRVRVFNEHGEVHCCAKLSESVRPGVVFLPKGLWSHHTLNGRTANALVPDTLTDVGGGATFNDARVQVQPLQPN